MKKPWRFFLILSFVLSCQRLSTKAVWAEAWCGMVNEQTGEWWCAKSLQFSDNASSCPTSVKAPAAVCAAGSCAVSGTYTSQSACLADDRTDRNKSNTGGTSPDDKMWCGMVRDDTGKWWCFQSINNKCMADIRESFGSACINVPCKVYGPYRDQTTCLADERTKSISTPTPVPTPTPAPTTPSTATPTPNKNTPSPTAQPTPTSRASPSSTPTQSAAAVAAGGTISLDEFKPSDYKIQTDAGRYSQGVVTIAFFVGMFLTFFYLIYGTISWITSSGDTSKLETARKRILHATIGLLIVAASWALYTLIIKIAFNADPSNISIPKLD